MTKKPLLLFVAPFYMPRNYGGAPQLYDQLLRHLPEWDVVVLGQREANDPEAMARFDDAAPSERGYRMARVDRFSIHYRSASRVGRLFEAIRDLVAIPRQFDRMIRQLCPDLVFCGATLEAGWLLHRLPPAMPLANYVLGEELTMQTTRGPLSSWLRRRQIDAYRRIDLNVVISRFSIDCLRQLAPVPDEKILYVPCFIDAETFRPPVDREEARRDLGWEGRTILLTVARFVRRKGIDNVLRALAQARGLPDDWLYVIGGTGPDEVYLRDLVRDLGLAERVRFIGFVAAERLPSLYGAADLFVQANRDVDGDTEGFGIVFLEANACGTAVLGGRAGGTGDAIEDGVTGQRVDGSDVDAIERELARMLGDRVGLARMGAMGRQRVLARFSVDVQARKVHQALAMTLARRVGRAQA